MGHAKGTFPRSHRLISSRDYQRVYRMGRWYSGRRVRICYCFGKRGCLGITISRKWGKAHERNRFKRVVREGYRLSHLPDRLEVNVHPMGEYRTLTAREMRGEFDALKGACGKRSPPRSTSSLRYQRAPDGWKTRGIGR